LNLPILGIKFIGNFGSYEVVTAVTSGYILFRLGFFVIIDLDEFADSYEQYVLVKHYCANANDIPLKELSNVSGFHIHTVASSIVSSRSSTDTSTHDTISEYDYIINSSNKGYRYIEEQVVEEVEEVTDSTDNNSTTTTNNNNNNNSNSNSSSTTLNDALITSAQQGNSRARIIKQKTVLVNKDKFVPIDESVSISSVLTLPQLPWHNTLPMNIVFIVLGIQNGTWFNQHEQKSRNFVLLGVKKFCLAVLELVTHLIFAYPIIMLLELQALYYYSINLSTLIAYCIGYAIPFIGFIYLRWFGLNNFLTNLTLFRFISYILNLKAAHNTQQSVLLKFATLDNDKYCVGDAIQRGMKTIIVLDLEYIGKQKLIDAANEVNEGEASQDHEPPIYKGFTRIVNRNRPGRKKTTIRGVCALLQVKKYQNESNNVTIIKGVAMVPIGECAITSDDAMLELGKQLGQFTSDEVLGQ